MKRAAGLLVVSVLCGAALATVAVAESRLAVPDAAERSTRYAKRTCAHDPSCIGSGVLNCNRKGDHVVLCRVFDERRTKVQGRYRCERLVRISLDPHAHRMPVTGLGAWHC